MTSNSAEELALREQYPLYAEACREDEETGGEDELTRADFERDWRENR